MITSILFFLGILLLLKGADYLVEGASSLAKRLRVSTLVIGLTIVAFGTSMPELIVNVLAAIKGSGEIAIGNIIGSNIANILLILGITAIILPLRVQNSTITKEIPFSLLAAVILFIFVNINLIDSLVLDKIYRFQGIILLSFFIIFLYYTFELTRKDRNKSKEIEIDIKRLSRTKIVIYIFGGLIGLYFGGRWTVNGAIALARLWGMSEYFISLTVIAIGTSLPELVTSIVAALKKDVDLAVGNIVGSNIFNILWILGISSIITPLVIPKFIFLDMAVLLISTILLFLFMFIGKKRILERWQGILFVLGYLIYIIYLVFRV
jgi:cation:H+ antiporter